jgi:hypothetical protein
MKVGDKVKYKGGFNPEYIGYEYIQFDKEYKVVGVDDACIELILDKNIQWVFTIDQIHSFFIPCIESKDEHYDNTNGSLYKFAEQQGLNAWEFDILKRLVRCRKKGQFKEDLEKTKRVIDLYLKEFES